MSTFMFKFLNHDLRLLKFNKPLHFFAEMPHLRYGLEDGLLEKYLVITSQKLKLKNLHRKLCLSKQEVLRKLPVQNTDRTGPG